MKNHQRAIDHAKKPKTYKRDMFNLQNGKCHMQEVVDQFSLEIEG